jgi:hypothetical protein
MVEFAYVVCHMFLQVVLSLRKSRFTSKAGEPLKRLHFHILFLTCFRKWSLAYAKAVLAAKQVEFAFILFLTCFRKCSFAYVKAVSFSQQSRGTVK